MDNVFVVVLLGVHEICLHFFSHKLKKNTEHTYTVQKTDNIED